MHSIPVKAIRIAQQRLKSAGLQTGPADGALGRKTEDALNRALESLRNELDTGQEDRILNGSRRRKVTVYIS
jgi:lysozyme family protein